MKRLLILACILTLLCACALQKAYLVDLPEQSPAESSLVTPSPSPEPELCSIVPINGDGFTTDSNGLPILDEQRHYFDYYLAVTNMRIYEQNEETLIDAVISNSYGKTLIGALRIVFRGEDGILFGYGDFYTASGELKLLSGENRVYCDVLTEVNVQDLPYEFTIVQPFGPEQ